MKNQMKNKKLNFWYWFKGTKVHIRIANLIIIHIITSNKIKIIKIITIIKIIIMIKIKEKLLKIILYIIIEISNALLINFNI